MKRLRTGLSLQTYQAGYRFFRVKLEFRSLKILALVLFLLCVVVGNGLSFHSGQNDGEPSGITFAPKVNSQIANPEQLSSNDGEACLSGYCHIGHCDHLILSKTPGPVYEGLAVIYFVKIHQLTQSYVEEPFQPPRMV